MTGVNIPNYATLSISPASGVKVCNNAFNTTALSGYNGRPALWLHSDLPIFNSQSSTDAWFVLNGSLNEITLAYSDLSAPCPLTGTAHAVQSSVRNTTSISSSGGLIFSLTGVNDQHTFTVRLQNNATVNNVTNTWLSITDGGSDRINASYHYDYTNGGYVLGYGSGTTSDLVVSYDGQAVRKTDHEYDSSSNFGTITHFTKL